MRPLLRKVDETKRNKERPTMTGEIPTPRTDAAMGFAPILGSSPDLADGGKLQVVTIHFARTLERELTQLRARAEKAEGDNAELKAHMIDGAQIMDGLIKENAELRAKLATCEKRVE